MDQYIAVSAKIKERWVDREWEKQWLEKLESQKRLWDAYNDGTAALESLARELEAYLQSLGNLKQSPAHEGAQTQGVFSQTVLWLIALVAVPLGIMAYRRFVLSRG